MRRTKIKKQIALNKLFNFFMIIGALLVWICIESLLEGDVWLSIALGIAALLFLIIPSIFTPYCYLFDSEGVSLCYVFLPVERYLWKNIYSIEVSDITIGSGGGKGNPFEFFYAFVFCIEGKNVGNKRFYMNGQIRKSFRTKYLLEKYWDGTITGYLFEDVKKWFNKRKTKNKVQIEAHRTEEIVKMEREIRAKIREYLKPHISFAKQNDLYIKIEYIYVTKDFEELKSRPKEGYTYTLLAKISRLNNKNGSQNVSVSVDLIYVRLGKKAYLGVENEHFVEEINVIFKDTLNEIVKNCIELYCANN